MIIFFGIGTNLGNREANLQDALRLLNERVGEQLACSSIYRSAPQGFVSDNEFANIVVAYRTSYSPEEVLLLTQQIERDLGRKQKSVNGIYHDRIIDIDLLKAYTLTAINRYPQSFTDINRHSPLLSLPHPRMHERDFVLVPLNEVEKKLGMQDY
jgi:2-amino-4-hydroxy-6-hydroxymethyldihydropteridine diphosphokinase